MCGCFWKLRNATLGYPDGTETLDGVEETERREASRLRIPLSAAPTAL